MSFKGRALIAWATAFTKAQELVGENFTIDWLSGWYSQYGQDRRIMKWLYSEHAANAYFSYLKGEQLQQGVFIELGAGDGVDKSNTLAFEEKLGWTGLLIEPASSLYQQLVRNRPHATCVQACVAGAVIEKEFFEDGLNSGTTGKHKLSDVDSNILTCQPLGALIDAYLGSKGNHIDYLSLDVEGSELEILRNFNFKKHQIDVISIELDRSFGETRYKRVSKLLTRNGFRFMERIALDEVWVRQRGATPDPTCAQPLVKLETPRKDWGYVRTTMNDFLHTLQQLPDESESWKLNIGSDLEILLHHWAEGDLRHWDEQCPVGILTLGLAYSLLRNRNNELTADSRKFFRELREHTVFFWTERLAATWLDHRNGFGVWSFS
eukprot:Skav205016  [mRNA]  locus=scaffold1026:22806:23942:+ [translate_table: standard]